MLDGEVTDAVEAQSLSFNPNHIHIYSASWGPEDDGKTVDGPARLAKEAFEHGVSEGRGGLGSIFVWASGNGGREHDSCNCDGYTNSIYTLSISSSTQYGNVPWYSEACSSTLATTYSSGNLNEKQIVTTDLRQKCTDSHTGTSASAPLAAGIIALALEANMNLTWRDMQHLVVRTSRPAHLNTNDWKTNGVGRKGNHDNLGIGTRSLRGALSHSYGYGLLDAGAMVTLARNWTNVEPQHKCVIVVLSEPSVPWRDQSCCSGRSECALFCGGNVNDERIVPSPPQVTTDLRQKCTDSHTGTSASAPLAAGIIALALEANMNLTWRDMQHLVVRTSRPAHLNTNDWKTNGVGRKGNHDNLGIGTLSLRGALSHSYGYGLLDAGAMVTLARNWTNVEPQHKCVIVVLSEPRDIGNRLVITQKVDACFGMSNYVSSLEHAQAQLTLSYNRRGDLAVYLISPKGTRSTLLSPRPHDYSSEGFNDWAFMTTHSWDEDPRGEWTLEIENASGASNYGTLRKFTLVLYGTGSNTMNFSTSNSSQPKSSSCKTLNANHICVECSPGSFLFQQGCVRECPPGMTPGTKSSDTPLDNWSEPSLVQACLQCHTTCLTCQGPGPTDCLSCPPHNHLNPASGTCAHQNQIQRESPDTPVGSSSSTDSSSFLELSSHLPIAVAVLSCAFIVASFVGVFLMLQICSGNSPWGMQNKLRSLESMGGVGGLGLGRGGIISYKGIPSGVWKEDEAFSDTDEEFDFHERTAFIKTQSAL
ncbi:UNVERIFIED_CONTAM: hypothetical protein FKN15_000804 [Acipenser sinensis]